MCGVLACCHMLGAQTAESPLLKFFERKSGLITFIAPDGNVHVINQVGAGDRALTDDAGSKSGSSVLYAAVTWSPDGKRVAFSRFSINSGTVTEASLYTVRSNGDNRLQLFTTKDLQPFYLSWSPDSRRISLLSQVAGKDDLELGVSSAEKKESYTALDRGAPYYWDWLSDSASIAAHANAQRGGPAGERLTLITIDPAPRKTDIPVETDLFQAPDISPDGKSIAYVRSDEKGFSLHVHGIDDSTDQTIARDMGAAYFAFAPDGRHIAYLAAFSAQPVPQGFLSIVSLDGARKSIKVAETPVLGFFWAPDSRKLAAIVPDPSADMDPMFLNREGGLTLRIVGCDAATAKTWTIARFPTARGLLTILPFFDQYQRSATIWSPDSRFVVFSAFSAGGDPSVYVARADGNHKPRLLAPGDSAFWSWK